MSTDEWDDEIVRTWLEDRQRRGSLPQRRIPEQGVSGVVNWPVISLAPREQKKTSVELEIPFVLEWFVLCHGDLEKLSVIDLWSGERSLFVSRGPYPASVFRDRSFFGPSFGRVLTRLGEKLTLEIVNLSDDVVILRSGFGGRGFESCEDGEAYLAHVNGLHNHANV
jgi:hypothetical protein